MITAVLPGYYPTLVQNVAATPLVTPSARGASFSIAPADEESRGTIGSAVNIGVNRFNALDNVNDLLVNQFRADTLGLPATRAQTRGGGTVVGNGFLSAGTLLDSDGLFGASQISGRFNGVGLGDEGLLGGTNLLGSGRLTEASTNTPPTLGTGGSVFGNGVTFGARGLGAVEPGDTGLFTRPLIDEYNAIRANTDTISRRGLLDLVV